MTNQKFCSPRPCDACPFRTDNGFILSVTRVKEICASLLQDKNFPCHKTLDYDGDDGEGSRNSKTMECAGAVIMLEHMGRPHQLMRIAERLRYYDRTTMDMDAPVFTSAAEMVTAYKSRNKRIGVKA